MTNISRREFLRLSALKIGAIAGVIMGGSILQACDQELSKEGAPPPSSTDLIQTNIPSPTDTLPSALPTKTNLPPTLQSLLDRPKQLRSSLVSLVQSDIADAKDLQLVDIQTMVQQAISLAGGFASLVQDGHTVVIKPNLYGRVYTINGQPIDTEVSGLVVDWRVTRAVVELVRQLNPTGKVYVMEGSCLAPTKEIMRYLKYSPEFIPGVDEFLAIEEDSGAWQDFNSPGLLKMDLSDGLYQTSYYLNRKYKEADVVISLATLKNHSYAAITGAVKNVAIGATPANIYGKSSTDDNRYDKIPHDKINFHKWVHDYYRCRPADFAIIDGLQGIQNGPMCYSDKCDLPENQMNMRLLLAGRDAVAVDTIQTLLMGWDPESIQYLNLLNASLAGNLDTAYITVSGKPVDLAQKDFAGAQPVCGGKKVVDKQAPGLLIEESSVSEGELRLTLANDEKTNKIEVYIDDHLFNIAITPDINDVVVNVNSLSSGTHAIKVWSYDRYLNRSEQTREIII